MASTNPSSVLRDSQIAGNPFVWLVVTMVVVLIAYIWMEQVTEEIVTDPVKKLSPEAASKNLEQVESIIKQETMAITSGTDQERAQEYLDAEFMVNTIDPLFKAADQHMDLGQYVLPDTDNAWYDYQQILTFDPDNTKARAGQTRIRNLLIDNAEIALEAGDYAEAENWLVQLDVVEPGGSIQEDLRQNIEIQIKEQAKARIAEQEEQEKMLKIENSLAQAHEEEQNKPINYNKIKDLYNRVLELDPKNMRAREGMSRMADDLLDQAESALRAGNFEKSRDFLQRTAAIEPDNKRLSSVQLAFDTRLSQVKEQEKKAEQERKRAIAILQQQSIETDEQAISESNQTAQPDQSIPESAQDGDPDQPAEVIEQDAASLDGAIVVEEVTADEIAQLKRNKAMDEGISAYYNGNYNHSFEMLYPLAEEGYARAQFRIGVMYRYGRSVSINQDLSEKWFTTALPSILKFAQKGVPWAQTDLGTAYELGISLNQDFERAAYWYRLAANQNYAGAQTNLGVLYANGEGVNYNRSEAVFWLRKAARQGDLVAIENLKIMGVTL